MANEAPKLDHATERIVTELAAALLPKLNNTVSAELAKTIEALPINIDREVSDVMSSLKRLQVLSADMTVAMNSVQSSALRVSDELVPLSGTCETLSQTCETLDVATKRLENLTTKSELLDAVQLNKLLCSLETAILDWGGVLKADGRAHTKELSEFSSEMSEILSAMKSNLLQTLNESLEKVILTRTEAWSEMAVEHVKLLDAKLLKFSKILMLEGIIFIILFMTALFFKLI